MCGVPMALVDLIPVDRVDLTTLVDNSADMLLPDRGLVRRWGLSGSAGPLPIVPSDVAEGGSTLDFLRAEHGYSALIELHHDGRRRRVLYDAGITPDGLISNLDRLGIAPDSFEAIVFSHGHFDHVGGMHGFIKRIRPRNLPVLLHPEFWTRRRLASPGHEIELPTPSRAALEGAGFDIIEERQPSFLLDGMLLITGEVPRVTDFETGMPPGHQSFSDGAWRHDPLGPRGSGRRPARTRQGARDPHRLRPCGHRQHRPPRQAPDRDRRRLPDHGRAASARGAGRGRIGCGAERGATATLVPAHCTSWVAHSALLEAMPDAYRPNAVGSRFELSWDADEGQP